MVYIVGAYPPSVCLRQRNTLALAPMPASSQSGLPLNIHNELAAAPAAQWDAFVAAHPAAHFLQTSGWGQLKSHFNWTAYRVVCQDPSLDIIAGAQLLHTRRRGVSLGYVPRGPLVNWDDMDQAAEMRDRMIALARAQGMHFIKIEPDLEDLPVHRLMLRELGFQPSAWTIQPRSTIRVDLHGSEQDLLSRMKSKWRYNIRKSLRSGTCVRQGTMDDLDTFLSLLDETSTRHNFHHHSLAYYRQAFASLPDTLCLLLAEVQGTAVAAVVVAATGHGAWYPWGASSARHRQAMPNYGLHFAAMQWARARKAAYYDLWGIPTPLGELARSIRLLDDRREWPDALPVDLQKLPKRDLWSVYRMKQGFGGHILHLTGAWDLPVQPAAYRLFLMGSRGLELARTARHRAGSTKPPAPATPPVDRRTSRSRDLHLEEVQDSRGWDQDLAQLPRASFMQSWEWGEVKAQAGWEPVRYRIRTADQASVGQFQILYRPIHPRLPLCMAYVPRGPALDWTHEGLVNFALEAIEQCARARHCLFVRLDPNVRRDLAPGMAAIARLEERNWYFSERPTQFQNTGYSRLLADPAARMASFKSRCRNKVRRAQRSDITIRRGTLTDLPEFYRLYADTGQRKGFAIRDFTYYQTVLSRCNLEGTGEGTALRSALLLAENPELGLVGGICLLALGSWAWYLYGASSEEQAQRARTTRCAYPNHLLQWEAMQWALEQGCSLYDWWGAPLDPHDRDDTLYGVWRFKQEFGARFQPLVGAWDHYCLPGPSRLAPRLLHTLRQQLQAPALIRGSLPV